MTLTYAQAEPLLAFVSGVSPGRKSAFQARLKQWQKNGFPEGINVGRGVRASYGAKQVYQLIFVLKLLQVGLTPERAQSVVVSAWAAIQDGIVEATCCLANGADHRHYLLVQLDALSDLKEESASHDHIFVEQFTGDEIAEAFGEPDDLETEDDQQRYEYFQFWVKNRMALTISVEVDSILIMTWAALEVSGVGAGVFAEEMAEWHAERLERGRATQLDKAYFDPTEPSKGSAAERVRDFDIVAAARAALSKVKVSEQHP